MSQDQPNNPLHGVTLKAIVEDLVARHGFSGLAERVPVRCFTHEPSLQSSLKFLRRTPWARERVEQLWVEEQRQAARKRERNRRRAARRAVRAQLEGGEE
jgi:uncharacterized protein (DUF2132 family)